jgi:periplasmic protein TonB
MSSRTVSTVAVVALVHTALIVTITEATKPPLRPDAIESRVIMAQLLSQEPAAAPSAAAPEALPPAAQPAPHSVVKKKVESHVAPPRPSPFPRPAPAPTPAPSQAAAPAAPTPNAAATHDASDAQPAAAPAPAGSRETLALSAPKSVRHIDCRIVKPDYPALSRRRGETGTADVRFVVGPTGAIESAELAKSSGYPRLDDAALAAMRESACRPYIENGTPMRVTYTQPFGFALDD